MKRLRTVFLVFSIAALGGLAWQVVHESRPPAKWLTVEAPRAAVADHPLPLRVTLPAPAPAGLLTVDLHWADSRQESHGYLSGGPAQAVTAAGGVFVFQIPIPPRPDLRTVTPIIFLGPSHDWHNRTHSARTDALPVRSAVSSETQALVPLAAFDGASEPAIQPANRPWVRGAIALLWLAAAAGEWRTARRRAVAIGSAALAWLRRNWLVLACLVAAGSEGANAPFLVSELFRRCALNHHVYSERHPVQQLATLAVIAGAAAVAWLALTRVKAPARSLALLALGMFAAWTLAELCSQHEVDRWFALEVGPLPLIQILKLVTAGAGVAAAWRQDKERRPCAPESGERGAI